MLKSCKKDKDCRMVFKDGGKDGGEDIGEAWMISFKLFEGVW